MKIESRNKQLGLSIVELMIALLLASLLSVGLVQIFTSNSQTSRVNEASARVQESGRLASDIMARVIRNSAYWGCTNQVRINLMLNDDGSVDLSNFTTGVDVAFNVASGNTWGAVPGSDVLFLGGVNTNAALRTTDQTPVNSATIFTGVDPRDYVDEGDILLISDCRFGDIFQATQVQNNAIVANTGGSTSPGNATQTQSEYPSGATVFRPQRNAFYVRENDGLRSLTLNPMIVSATSGVVGSLSGAEELVSEVWNMQVRLGVRAGSTPPNDSIVGSWETSWASISNEEDVIAIQISLLARSPQDNVVDQPQDLCFPGWLDCDTDPTLLTTMPDRRLYREFTLTTGIRSRLQ
ncbi:type IV pilus assembly protein PilW [Marinobacter pelagius]|uniref:Type IV pilus assembly protein PilW n=1 Tax=Marinobacter pelagius TaxID=379482 RepID=A0A366GP56_9GAMM|nr:PilW family protein [Marinobacter pelagius]RBP29196.1 type IV pilus assembly protein PilW [Marinobacter pelagius]